jgi:hypothetical protein
MVEIFHSAGSKVVYRRDENMIRGGVAVHSWQRVHDLFATQS